MPWIVEHPDGDVSQHIDAPGTAGVADGVRYAETPRLLDPAFEAWDWEQGAIVPLLCAWRPLLLANVDRQRAERGAALLSAGQAVQYAYTAKAAELYNYDVLSADVVGAMDSEELAAAFPWLSTEAAQLGLPLADAAARVRLARAATDAALRLIEAKAQAAKAAIRASDNLEDMQAAAAVDWEQVNG